MTVIARASVTRLPCRRPAMYSDALSRARRSESDTGEISLQLFKNLLCRDRNDCAGPEHARRTGLDQKVMVLRRNHAANDNQNVLPAEILQLGNYFRYQSLMSACKCRDSEYMDIILRGHPGHFTRSLKQRTDIDIEADIGERRCNHPGAAIMSVLAHLRH